MLDTSGTLNTDKLAIEEDPMCVDSGKENMDIGYIPSTMEVLSLNTELVSNPVVYKALVGVNTDDSGRSVDDTHRVEEGTEIVGGEEGSERLGTLDKKLVGENGEGDNKLI